jgi:hypothetical protein
MTPHKLWTFVGIVGAFAGIVDVARQHKSRKEQLEESETMPTEPELPLDADDPRDRIIAWAESQEGNTDHTPYWLSAIGRPAGDPDTDWCGAFVLAALHRQGLAKDRQWALGKGLEATLPKLVKTKSPERGDIAYFKRNQHVAIVADVVGDRVSLINGNSNGGRVVINDRPLKDAAAYYSIAPYLADAEAVS